MSKKSEDKRTVNVEPHERRKQWASRYRRAHTLLAVDKELHKSILHYCIDTETQIKDFTDAACREYLEKHDK